MRGWPATMRGWPATMRRWIGRHRWWSSLIGVVLVAGLVLGSSTIWVRATASGHLYTVADAPEAPVALVLGAGLRPDGTPSLYLAERLDVAAALYRAEKIGAVLVSGDNGTVEHDEPTAMRDYLVRQGVPNAKVVLDYAGFDTWDSCSRAKRIFGVDRALIVTQPFHLPRSVFSCRQAGIDADGVSADDPVPVRLSTRVRELPAGVKAAWDGLWNPDPTYLGAYEDGVDRALLASN